MIKTLIIDGKEVTFKSTGGTMMRYRNQFNSEFLADLAALKSVTTDNFSLFTSRSIEQIIWVLAKTSDSSIPDPQTWYDSFEEFPIYEVWGQLQDMVTGSFKTLRKNV